MPVGIDVRRFQESITEELLYTKDRVRNLIGAANWGEEGRYKEAILRKLIKQFLPANLEVGTGFIVANYDPVYGKNGLNSTQLDLIIYDASVPVVFKEGDFVILTESSVRGVIEVKSKVINYATDPKKSNALNNIISKFNQLDKFRILAKKAALNELFTGIFSFEYDKRGFKSLNLTENLTNSKGLVNHISLGPDCFIRYWPESKDRRSDTIPPAYTGRCYRLYSISTLSFSYFISNLLHITAYSELSDRYWFSFPIEGSKERHGIDTVELI